MARWQPTFLTAPPPGDRVRLRTLIVLRWMAIAGQVAAIGVATFFYDIRIPLGASLMAVACSVILNVVLGTVFAETRRLSEVEAMGLLLFDLVQLAALIVLNGGLDNPFALLIIAPVVISASALALRSTVVVGAAAIILISLAAVFHLPLNFADGSSIRVPRLFEFGFWLSIVIGITFLGFYSHRVATEIQIMSDALLATQMALAREQTLTDLGGVVAAAAHELGTPLATIKLVSAELMSELGDTPDLHDDARLIRDQADRCRDILRSMGRAGKGDLHLRRAPLEALLREAAVPHMERGKAVVLDLAGDPAAQPTLRRQPELIHGLRNIIQNAVDFAATTVWIDAVWTAETLRVTIGDDGPGYPPHRLGRLGDPFLFPRRGALGLDLRETLPDPGDGPERRHGYDGMGLGLFIAKTLLERSGAALTFANGSDPFLAPDEIPMRRGAIVEVIWPLARIAAPARTVLGKNAALAP